MLSGTTSSPPGLTLPGPLWLAGAGGSPFALSRAKAVLMYPQTGRFSHELLGAAVKSRTIISRRRMRPLPPPSPPQKKKKRKVEVLTESELFQSILRIHRQLLDLSTPLRRSIAQSYTKQIFVLQIYWDFFFFFSHWLLDALVQLLACICFCVFVFVWFF